MNTEASRDMARLRDESERLLAWQALEYTPTYTLDRQIALARWEMGEALWDELNADWEA